MVLDILSRCGSMCKILHHIVYMMSFPSSHRSLNCLGLARDQPQHVVRRSACLRWCSTAPSRTAIYQVLGPTTSTGPGRQAPLFSPISLLLLPLRLSAPKRSALALLHCLWCNFPGPSSLGKQCLQSLGASSRICRHIDLHTNCPEEVGPSIQ